MDSTHRRTPSNRKTGLRPGGSISLSPIAKPPSYAQITPQTSQPPADVYQHSEEDNSIASQEHHQMHSDDVEERSKHSRKSNSSHRKNSSTNSSFTSRTNKLNVPALPQFRDNIEK